MLTALRGVRVLDLTRMLAGPYATLLLADLGADVIKVERPPHDGGGGDEIRAVAPFVGGESAYFLSVNRSKRSVALDLGAATGRAVLRDLAARCDVVVENFRPDAAARLGCDWETLSSVNPRLVVCGMSAFGRTGPDRDLTAFDLTLQARGGGMSLTGEPGGAPVRMGPPMGDLAGGLFAAVAINAALYERERTGRGQFIDLALLDCQVALLTQFASYWLNAGVNPGPQGTGHPHAVPYQVFATADGHVAVAVFTDRFWPGFCRALGREAWAREARWATGEGRRTARDELVKLIGERFREGATATWVEALAAEAVPVAPVQRVAEVFRDPQVLARRMVAEMDHPNAGRVRAAGNPMKMGDWEHETHAAAPTLGADTDAVLRDVAGYDDATIAALRAAGVVG